VAGFLLECVAGFIGIRTFDGLCPAMTADVTSPCEFRRNPATDSELKPAGVPI
jgi:hypothetical protein